MAAMITPAQSRAARGLLDWTQARLAAEATLGLGTVRAFEKGRRSPTRNNLAALRHALEAAGVGFIGGDGVMRGVLREPSRPTTG